MVGSNNPDINIDSIKVYYHSLATIVVSVLSTSLYLLYRDSPSAAGRIFVFDVVVYGLLYYTITLEKTERLRNIQKYSVMPSVIHLFHFVYGNLFSTPSETQLIIEFMISASFTVLGLYSSYEKKKFESSWMRFVFPALYVFIIFTFPDNTLSTESPLIVMVRLISFNMTYYLNMYFTVIVRLEDNHPSYIFVSTFWLLFVDKYCIVICLVQWLSIIFAVTEKVSAKPESDEEEQALLPVEHNEQRSTINTGRPAQRRGVMGPYRGGGITKTSGLHTGRGSFDRQRFNKKVEGNREPMSPDKLKSLQMLIAQKEKEQNEDNPFNFDL